MKWSCFNACFGKTCVRITLFFVNSIFVIKYMLHTCVVTCTLSHYIKCFVITLIKDKIDKKQHRCSCILPIQIIKRKKLFWFQNQQKVVYDHCKWCYWFWIIMLMSLIFSINYSNQDWRQLMEYADCSVISKPDVLQLFSIHVHVL